MSPHARNFLLGSSCSRWAKTGGVSRPSTRRDDHPTLSVGSGHDDTARPDPGTTACGNWRNPVSNGDASSYSPPATYLERSSPQQRARQPGIEPIDNPHADGVLTPRLFSVFNRILHIFNRRRYAQTRLHLTIIVLSAYSKMEVHAMTKARAFLFMRRRNGWDAVPIKHETVPGVPCQALFGDQR